MGTANEEGRARKLQFCNKNEQEVIKIYCILLWSVGKQQGIRGERRPQRPVQGVNVQRITEGVRPLFPFMRYPGATVEILTIRFWDVGGSWWACEISQRKGSSDVRWRRDVQVQTCLAPKLYLHCLSRLISSQVKSRVSTWSLST